MGLFGLYVLKTNATERQSVDGLYSSFITYTRSNYDDDDDNERDGYSSEDSSAVHEISRKGKKMETHFIEEYAKMNAQERKRYDFYHLNPSLNEKATLIRDLNLKVLEEDEDGLLQRNFDEARIRNTDDHLNKNLKEEKYNQRQHFLDVSKILSVLK